MSECIVPSWKLNQQRQEVVAAGEETNATGTAHNHPLPPPPAPAAAYVVPMSNYEVARELTWENGQVAMHGVTFPYPSLSQPAANKVPTFVRTGDTLESIVHQATHYKKSTTPNQQENDVVVNGKNAGGNVGISKKKRPRTTTTSESDHHDEYMTMKFHGNIINNNNNNNNSSSSTKNIVREDRVVTNNNNNSGSGGGVGAKRERSACGSASATFCRDAATSTMMTWNSFESSPRSFKTKTTDEDSAYHDGASENRDEEDDETCRSRRSRAAIVHNQSERRRRDRINQKMKALQKLVPNASKTDKASMLDEVIVYLKQLQTQVHMLSTTTRSIPQMMINPLAIQQQQQQQQQQISSFLARMGMGMLDINTLAPFFQQHHGINIPTPPTFLPPIHFTVPAATVHASQPNKSPAAAAAGVPFSDPYSVYLAQVCQQKLSALNIKQTMNMEFYNKMAALYGQKVTNQATQTTSNSSHPNFIQRE